MFPTWTWTWTWTWTCVRHQCKYIESPLSRQGSRPDPRPQVYFFFPLYGDIHQMHGVASFKTRIETRDQIYNYFIFLVYGDIYTHQCTGLLPFSHRQGSGPGTPVFFFPSTIRGHTPNALSRLFQGKDRDQRPDLLFFLYKYIYAGTYCII